MVTNSKLTSDYLPCINIQHHLIPVMITSSTSVGQVFCSSVSFMRGHPNVSATWCMVSWLAKSTLPETIIFAPENGWLEYHRFLFGWPIFRGKLLVSGGVSQSSKCTKLNEVFGPVGDGVPTLTFGSLRVEFPWTITHIYISHRIYVWYIYLHLPDKSTKCR